MKINERLYPHPVQSHFSDDLTDCNFQVTSKIVPGKNSYKFELIARTSSSDLRALVAAEKAAYGLHVECAATRYRRLLISQDEQFIEEIPAECLDGKVELCSLIVATVDIPNYKNKNFHADYGDMSFFVKKGDVLAVGYDKFFDATKGIDPLQNVASIFKVRRNRNSAEPFTIDLLDNYVVILLSEQNYIAYSELRKDQDLQPTLASMIVMPALVQTIEQMKRSASEGSDEDSYTELRWFKVISSKLKVLGYKGEEEWVEESSLILAQKLIGNPLSSSLRLILDAEDEGAGD